METANSLLASPLLMMSGAMASYTKTSSISRSSPPGGVMPHTGKACFLYGAFLQTLDATAGFCFAANELVIVPLVEV